MRENRLEMVWVYDKDRGNGSSKSGYEKKTLKEGEEEEYQK